MFEIINCGCGIEIRGSELEINLESRAEETWIGTDIGDGKVV